MFSPLQLDGPTWLTENENLWPQKINIEADENAIAVEKMSLIFQTIAASESDRNFSSLFDLTKYSKLKEVYRVTAWIIIFFNNSKICGIRERKWTE